MTEEKIHEFTRRISQANTTDMVVVIYDITLEYIDEAAKAINDADRRKVTESVIRIRKCLNELIGSLHYEYSPAGELLQLYLFAGRQLTKVDRSMDINALQYVRSLIARLRNAYAQAATNNVTGAIMENAQSVYAGLTYGRGALNESVIGSINRGFIA